VTRKLKGINARRLFSNTTIHSKLALVMGSNGALGSAIASHLQYKGHEVIGADVTAPSDSTPVDAFIQLEDTHSVEELLDSLNNGMQELFSDVENELLDAIICANGGFAMDELENNAQVHDLMMRMNYFPTVAAAELCKTYMSTEDGLFVVFGAASASIDHVDSRNACGISAYAGSKNAVHYLVHSLGLLTGKRLSQKKTTDDFKIHASRIHPYLDELSVVGILPTILDTEANRASMGGEDKDYTSWTKVEDIAKEVGSWVDLPDLRPNSGSLIKAVTKNGETDFVLHR